jgi:CubicO group peptidase (beta-lactamase class C family)
MKRGLASIRGRLLRRSPEGPMNPRISRRTALGAFAGLFATAGAACARGGTTMTHGSASTLHDAMAAHVARGHLPGAAWLVGDGRRQGGGRTGTTGVQCDAVGTLRLGNPAAMQRDTLFRIASMTKPMVAAVAMTLVEDGTLALDAPVDRWLPELAGRRVLRRLDGPLDDTVPAKRAITVRDLLTFRMGCGIVWGPPPPIVRAANELHLGAFGPPRVQEPPAPDEWMRRFATLPLMSHPGEQWRYHTSAEILGVLLARASGRPLDVVMRERLFAPLGMKDTGFHVPPAELPRLATSYLANPETGALDLYDPAEGGDFARAPAFPSGGGGLVSTLDDCHAFVRAMLGESRLLSRASIEAMTTDHIAPAEQPADALAPGFWDAFGWGYGCAIVRRRAPDRPFGCGWDGGFGTAMWWDAATGAFAILMTQRMAYPAMNPVYLDFWRAVNTAG